MPYATAGDSGGASVHHYKMFAPLMSACCWHLKVAEMLIPISPHLGYVFPWGIQVWALILPRAGKVWDF